MSISHLTGVTAPDAAETDGGASAPPFILLSDGAVLVGRGVSDPLVLPAKASIADALDGVFASDGAPLVVGALPFDRNGPPLLYRPRSVDRVEPALRGRTTRVAPAGAWQVTSLPSRALHKQNVERALALLSDPGPAGLRKVVLARSLVCRAPGSIDADAVLRQLRQDGSVTTFAVPLPAGDDGRARRLVGATPELLVARRGAAVRSRPLAGSARRGSDAAADRDIAARLGDSFKDRREHAAVVEAILDTLAPYCRELKALERDVVATATMLHLRTGIEGVLRDETISVMELVEALHPTPAVCGLPKDRARAVIANLEPFDRGYYGGAVGWCDAAGDSDWFVTIRCAEISGSVARLYAGGGLVPGSEPEAELAETSAKFETLLRALGIDETGAPSGDTP